MHNQSTLVADNDSITIHHSSIFGEEPIDPAECTDGHAVVRRLLDLGMESDEADKLHWLLHRAEHLGLDRADLRDAVADNLSDFTVLRARERVGPDCSMAELKQAIPAIAEEMERDMSGLDPNDDLFTQVMCIWATLGGSHSETARVIDNVADERGKTCLCFA
ncbi:hypothetical protein ASC77_19555 [Nocardioides sp. Root1257]|uniref:hypothetical protein n=1 Tax=unclassified Nocardioides TaxID=2615069 RepID=UPI0006F9C26D|nr:MULTISPECIES: hypothetical protein [unclassified Nocardioides]KQW44986.1 hypothetical protein ASC77_19555 [Nocardioides sp. Root1257]KRC46010.1 hypothetical protein ASE24_15665 [Nocardioides sp. Root224]